MSMAETPIAAQANVIKVPFRMWPNDTRAIVGSILLAVCFSVNMQITERIDAATTGGLLPWLGAMFVNLWFPAAVIFFGLTGGLIAANFNPIIAVLTATHPLAPVFFAANMSYVIPFALLVRRPLESGAGLTFRQFFAYAAIAQIPLIGALWGLWVFMLKLPLEKMLLLSLWGWAMFIPGAFLGFHFCRAITRSGVVE